MEIKSLLAPGGLKNYPLAVPPKQWWPPDHSSSPPPMAQGAHRWHRQAVDVTKAPPKLRPPRTGDMGG